MLLWKHLTYASVYERCSDQNASGKTMGSPKLDVYIKLANTNEDWPDALFAHILPVCCSQLR